MAQRRMFSLKVIDTDHFLDMSPTAQLLYFHLAMRADDDGFVSSPKRILKMANAPDDDMKILIAKRYIIPFESGVCVIKDWSVHNLIRSDRYTETEYKDEKAQLVENHGKYELKSGIQNVIPNVIPNGNQMEPQVRLGKVRKGKETEAKTKFSQDGADVLKSFESVDPKNKTLYNNKTERAAADFLINEYGKEFVEKVIAILPKTNKLNYIPTITKPSELKEKWVKLRDALEKAKTKDIKTPPKFY